MTRTSTNSTRAPSSSSTPPASGTIIVGDCIEAMTLHLATGSVALVVADPPYNISANNRSNRQRNGRIRHRITAAWDKMSPDEYAAFTQRWISEAHRVLVPKGSIYVCAAAGPTVTDVLVALRAAGFLVKNIITWHKPNGAPNPFGRLYTRASELIVFAVKASGWTFHAKALRDLNPERQQDGSPKMMRDVWTIPATSGHERLRGPGGRAIHPTQKPEAVIRRLIVASSNPGDLLLDPFLGSGTTAIVAESLGRRWIGIEQSRSYVAAARARLQRARRQRGPVRAHRTSVRNRSDRSPHAS